MELVILGELYPFTLIQMWSKHFSSVVLLPLLYFRLLFNSVLFLFSICTIAHNLSIQFFYSSISAYTLFIKLLHYFIGISGLQLSNVINRIKFQ